MAMGRRGEHRGSRGGLPRIGVSANLFPAADRPLFKNKPLYVGEASMVHAVQTAGGLPMVMPFPKGEQELDAWVDLIEGLLLTGGADVAPETYGDSPVRPAWGGQRVRDEFEIAIYRRCRERGIPVLGICRGAQLLNVAEGGTLWQDIVELRPESLVHRSQEQYDALGHDVQFEEGCQLARVLGTSALWVNSVHHQAVRELAAPLRAVAFAPDGVIEALEHTGSDDVLAVQWHPEWMGSQQDIQGRLFSWLIDRACAYRARLEQG